MVETRWIIAQDVEQQKVKELSKAIGVDDKLATLLNNKCLRTKKSQNDTT